MSNPHFVPGAGTTKVARQPHFISRGGNDEGGKTAAFRSKDRNEMWVLVNYRQKVENKE